MPVSCSCHQFYWECRAPLRVQQKEFRLDSESTHNNQINQDPQLNALHWVGGLLFRALCKKEIDGCDNLFGFYYFICSWYCFSIYEHVRSSGIWKRYKEKASVCSILALFQRDEATLSKSNNSRQNFTNQYNFMLSTIFDKTDCNHITIKSTRTPNSMLGIELGACYS